MPTYNVTAPDGRKVKLTGDTAPNQQQLDDIFSKLPQQTQDQPATPQQPQGKSLAGFGKNVLTSTGGVLGGILNSILHPVTTAKTLANIPIGVGEKIARAVDPSKTKPPLMTGEKTVNSIVDQYKSKYGSADSFKNTLYNDPAGTALDLSMILDAGASAVGKVGEIGKVGEASTIAKTAETGSKLADLTSPVNEVLNLFKGVKSGISKVTDPIKEAIDTKKLLKGVKPGTQESLRAKDLVATAKDYGMSLKDFVEKSPEVTGKTGLLSDMVNYIINNAPNKANLDSVLGYAREQLTGSTSLFKGWSKQLSADEKAIYDMTDRGITNAQGLVGKGDLTTKSLGTSVNVDGAFQVIQDLQGESSRIKSIKDATTAQLGLAGKVDKIVSNIKKELFTNTNADSVVANGGHIANSDLAARLEGMPAKLQQEIKSATSVQELRSLQEPFVRGSRMSKAIEKASQIISQAPKGTWEKLAPLLVKGGIGGAAYGATHSPLAALLPFLYGSDTVEAIGGQVGKTVSSVGKSVAKVGKAVEPAATSPTLQNILNILGKLK